MPNVDLVGVNEIAKLLDYHPQYVRDLTLLKKLPAKKIGWNWWYDKTLILDLQKKAKKVGSSVSKLYLTQKMLAKNTEETIVDFK